MDLLSRFTRRDYKDGEDFLANYSYTAPENFNFARDVIDEYARLAPDQVAMIWTNDAGEERIFTFAELARLSIKAANALRALGVQQGEPVLLMLKRRYEYWLCALGLMRIGAIQIPATHQLQEKDITYRVNAADARTLICVGEEELLSHVRASKEKCPHLRVTAALGGAHEGFEDFSRLLAEAPDTMDGCYDPAPEDVMLIYFTSGTTGMPKMLAHDFRYGLGHLITGAFWHNLTDKSVHITTADSGWAKCGWGKFYGQWIAGAVNFIYDFDRFNAQKMLAMLAKYHVTSFCAPPTIYRFLIKEDFSGHDLSALQWATCAGEPLNPEVYNQFYRLTGVKIHEAFGQSETTPLLVTHKWMEPIPGSTGVPSPRSARLLVDATGATWSAARRANCVSTSPRAVPAACSWATTRTRNRRATLSATACTTPATWSGRMRRATTTSSAAPMTSSSPPATASAPSRSKAPSSATPRSSSAPSPACRTPCAGRWSRPPWCWSRATSRRRN